MQDKVLSANGASLHLAETGQGAPLLLLHGWPEFWLTREPVMMRLAGRHRVIAPDLRGFGDSDKPSGPFGAENHAADMLALLDTLTLRCRVVATHQLG
jgi:pimeloyl-ACP methyl ester carboxylesterase